MLVRNKLSLAISLLATAGIVNADLDPQSANVYLEETTVIGTKSLAKEVSASAIVINEADLEVFHDRDINKILLDAPGVYLAAEEGWGLRPNIGIRGTGTSRSSKVTILEDGVLVAPAPYSNPDAYYFPTASRMVGVEVLKGSPILEYGPATIGGVLNLVSAQIPEADFAGRANVEAGSFDTYRALANVGGQGANVGWMIEAQNFQSDGFQDIDRSGQDTGFDKNDVTAKFRVHSDDVAGEVYHQLDFKYQYAEETSNMSYFGLTDADFNDNADRRYGLTGLDEMDNSRDSYSVNYQLRLSEALSVSALVYRNEFQRDWFKVDKINGVSGSSLMSMINTNGADAALYQSWLDGSTDIADIDIKHNNRAYVSEGVQLVVNGKFDFGGTQHDVRVGVRDHSDEMDRFQPVESYAQINGELVFVSTTAGNVTGSNNRIETGDALAFWLVDDIQVNEALKVNLAIRNENMDVSRRTFSDNDRVEEPTRSSNDANEWLFGASATYELSDAWTVLGGIQQGMTPISGGSKKPDAPETSTNYEFGARWSAEATEISMIGFYSDYANTVQYCSNAYPCDNGETQGSLSLGESEVVGFEFRADTYAEFDSLTMPVGVAYTYTQAEVTEGVDGATDVSGDEWAYIPANQLSATIGLVDGATGISGYLRASYVEGACTVTGCNRTGDEFSRTDDQFSIDASAHYALTDSADLYLNVDNLLDDRSIASRSPYGARANMPRSFTLGLDYKF